MSARILPRRNNSTYHVACLKSTNNLYSRTEGKFTFFVDLREAKLVDVAHPPMTVASRFDEQWFSYLDSLLVQELKLPTANSICPMSFG
jgi:hypothetical protein